ncbi:MAG: cytochrome C oxidase subunit IV family protein [Candidatus Hodarchaeota archaeon]
MTGVSDLTDNESYKIKRPYNLVVIFLAFFTIIEVFFGFLNDLVSDQADLQFLIRLGLVILALAKAYLVAAFFMGIKYQPRPYVIYGVVFGIPLLIALPVVIIPLIGTILHITGH